MPSLHHWKIGGKQAVDLLLTRIRIRMYGLGSDGKKPPLWAFSNLPHDRRSDLPTAPLSSRRSFVASNKAALFRSQGSRHSRILGDRDAATLCDGARSPTHSPEPTLSTTWLNPRRPAGCMRSLQLLAACPERTAHQDGDLLARTGCLGLHRSVRHSQNLRSFADR